jgi:hypothetical protein
VIFRLHLATSSLPKFGFNLSVLQIQRALNLLKKSGLLALLCLVLGTQKPVVEWFCIFRCACRVSCFDDLCT